MKKGIIFISAFFSLVIPAEANAPIKVDCQSTPKIVRFEDGSAHIRCDGKVIVSIGRKGW